MCWRKRLTIMAAVLAAGRPCATYCADLDSLLAFYSKSLSRNRHFSTSFTQSRYLSMFKKPLVSTGTISFSHPDRIRFHYKTPFESVILLAGGTMKRYRIENGVYTEQPSLEIVARAITKEITRYLSGDFTGDDFPYDVSIDPDNDRHVLLIPTRSAAKAVFERIELLFPDDPVYIRQIKLIEPSGDCITVEHDTPSFAPVPDSLFDVP
jgi:outer membrane lipoprotein-sorting protein